METVIILLLYDFWGHIGRGTAKDPKLAILRSANTETEIDQFDIVSFVDNYILKFKVSVTDILIMKGSHGIAELSEKQSCLLFRKYTLGTFKLDILIETDSGDEFLNQIYILGSLEVIVELHNVWMVTFKPFHACDLSLNGLPLGSIVQLILRIDLNGNFLLGLFVLGQFDIRVGT